MTSSRCRRCRALRCRPSRSSPSSRRCRRSCARCRSCRSSSSGALEAIALLWFVNLVNFMDGIDWITVAETVPIAAGVYILSLFGAVPQTPRPGRAGASRRDARLCAVQPAGGEALSRRRRQPADRAHDGMAAAAACRQRPSRGCAAVAALLRSPTRRSRWRGAGRAANASPRPTAAISTRSRRRAASR